MPIGTSYQYHIFPNNAPWGIALRPRSSSSQSGIQYKHVVNFPDESKREEFVNSQLNNNSNYKTDLANARSTAFTFLDELRISFRHSAGNNLDRYLNADYMVIKIGRVEKFYALRVEKVDGQIIDYSGELDIFFTYKMRFRDVEVPIARAHVNRLNSDGTKFLPPIKGDNGLKELFYGNEPIEPLDYQYINLERQESDESDRIFFPDEIKWIIIQYQSPTVKLLHLPSQGGFFDTNSSGFSLFGNGIYSSPDKGDGEVRISSTYNIVQIPFIAKPYIDNNKNKVLIKPVYSLINNEFKPYFLHPGNSSLPYEGVTAYKFFPVNHPSVLGIYLSDKPMGRFTKEHWSLDKINDKWVLNYLTPFFSTHESMIERVGSIRLKGKTDDETDTEINVRALKVSSMYDIYSANPIEAEYNSSYLYDNTNSLFDPKIFSPQYHKIGISNPSIENIEYNLYDCGNIKNNNIFVNLYYKSSFDLANPHFFYWLKSNNKDNIRIGQKMIDDQLTELPTSIDKWKEWYIQNKNSIQARKFAATTNLGLSLTTGIAGALIAGLSGGTLGPVATAAFGSRGLGSIASYVIEMNNIEAQQKDVKNKPAELKKPNTSMFARFYDFLTPTTSVYEKTPSENDRNRLLKFINRFGYNMGSYINPINSYLENRNNWNYIQANDIISALDLPVSAKVKGIIGRAFEDGITFWHYRNANLWNGVLNYNNENRETNWNISSVRNKRSESDDKKVLQNSNRKRTKNNCS